MQLKGLTLHFYRLLMTEHTVIMDCFVDDLLRTCRPAWAPEPYSRQPPSDTAVLMQTLVAARYFGGNLAQVRRYVQAHWAGVSWIIMDFRASCITSKTYQTRYSAPIWSDVQRPARLSSRYILDSFSVAACHAACVGHSKLLPGKAYHCQVERI